MSLASRNFQGAQSQKEDQAPMEEFQTQAGVAAFQVERGTGQPGPVPAVLSLQVARVGKWPCPCACPPPQGCPGTWSPLTQNCLHLPPQGLGAVSDCQGNHLPFPCSFLTTLTILRSIALSVVLSGVCLPGCSPMKGTRTRPACGGPPGTTVRVE